MRRLPLVLLSFAVAGCAGNVADYVGPRSNIISPQLIRYGLDVEQSRCIGPRLGARLPPLELRRFQRLAAALRQGWFEPDRLTARDLVHVAESMRGSQVKTELEAAMQACSVTVETALPQTAAPAPVTNASPAATWLNLGAAPTGQSIAVDASSLEQDAASRTAWFRLTNPGEAAPTGTSYKLRIDCRARTIAQLDLRREGAAPAIAGQPSAAPIPIEGGTVMEIAYLAMCT
jgi:hypothetical protein